MEWHTTWTGAELPEANSNIIIKTMIEIKSTTGANPDSILVRDMRNAVELFMTHLTDVKMPVITRFLLYGSRARGDYHADSDVDIAVVLPGTDPGDGTLFKLLMRLSDVSSRTMLELERPLNIQAIVMWEAELREPEKQHNPDFYRNVVADGLEINVIH